ncbi:hypothetical protein G4G28_14015 [Massilia sp. Dwa41.01b]|uniref:dynamin family protein n=1 Tax=unclassified Massilia TaxID=2609279 RepID=UPI0016002E02|nr:MULTISPECIES: dynamin family protein [unclassified Massilia]QNA89303.1 hypothetical protein G4G28_14015 [Massilia sp. Dwa41.01b]QNB00205.1 hypothetical protein G4G31_17595 [Massilia sp. Se16.2.3]
MSINPTQLLQAYDQARAFVEADPAMAAAFSPIGEVFEDKKKSADAVIMVYGVYNAGKSTLINALLQREIAPADDIPLTDKVTAYEWGNYSILDTPGVDAPIAHENVTRAQMLKADAILFVVDPLGTVEEAKTLDVLLEMLEERKQVFLVFNDKKNLGDADFIKLKDQTRGHLQKMAAARGLNDVLGDIPIAKINARRALRGFVEGEPALVELSGFPAFERQLTGFLQSVGLDEVYGRLQGQLAGFLQEYVALLESRTDSALVKKYDRLLGSIGAQQSRVTQAMRRELGRQRSQLADMARTTMRTAPDDCQARIEQLMIKAGQAVSDTLQHELQQVVSSVQVEIEELEAVVPRMQHQAGSVEVPTLGKGDGEGGQGGTPAPLPAASAIDIKGAMQQLAGITKPEHIVSGLKLVKEVAPSLMKGIGTRTMEKWAGSVVGKWLPYVGIAVSVGEVLYGLFRGDPEEARLRQQHEEQQRARERAVQQMEDFARELGEGFETSMQAGVDKEIGEFFANVSAHVEKLRQAFSEADQAASARVQQLVGILRLALDA